MSALTPTVTTTSIFCAVVPAAGLGTRLRPLTNAIPKELLPIGREPVLAHVVAELRAAGITQVLFVISERKPQIRNYFGDGCDGDGVLPALTCDYLVQTEQRGSGDAVLCAESWVGDRPFVVAFGDCLIESSETASPLQRLMAAHEEAGATASALVEAVERSRVSRYGVVAPAEPLPATPRDAFAISGVVEKPAVADAPSNLVIAARWVLQPAIFAALRARVGMTPGELNIPDPVNDLMRLGAACCAVPLRPGEARRDIGNLESFLTQFVRTALRDPEYGATVRQMIRDEFADPPK